MRAGTIGVGGRLLLGALAIFAAVELGSGLVIEHRLRLGLEHRIERELRHTALTGCDLIEELPAPGGLEAMEALASHLSRSGEARITIVAADGRVLGDSELTADEVRAAENHGTRPEVREAVARGVGTSRRYSRTAGTSLLYVAAACGPEARGAVVRAATSLAHVDALVREQRVILLSVGAIAFLVAALAGWIGSFLALRRLRRMVAETRAAAGARRLEVPATGDEVGRIAGSFNRVAEELDRTLHRLADERDRLGKILGSLREAVIALDGDGRISLVNPAAVEMLGAERGGEELAGLHLLEVVRAPELLSLVDRVRGDGAGAEAELDLPGETRRRILARATVLEPASAVVLVMVDVTEVRKLETIRRDFVANVSHELRTPVSVIRANAETLLDGALDDPDEATQFAEAIGRNAERLSKIIADLLDLSQLEAGRLDLEVVPVPLAVAVGHAFELVEKAARAKDLALSSAVPRELVARADATALDHVLLDLLDNAVKYTQRGGRIEVRAELRGDRVEVVVQDDGPGIEPRHRERIFERFYRVDKGRSREVGGTGLGLSIAKHLVEALGGEIGMRPASPRGSEFWLALPAGAGLPGGGDSCDQEPS